MLRLVHLLLPVLFPSWRFFKEVGPSPRIEVPGPDGCWVSALPRPARLSPAQRLGRLFYNPTWNEDLYLLSLCDRLLVEGTVQAVDRLSARLAARLKVSPETLVFRIALVTRERDGVHHDIAYEHP